MSITSDRVAGFCSIFFGLVLLFWLTPFATETVDYGWMRPKTLPDILAWILIFAGSALAGVPSEPAGINFLFFGKAVTYFVLIVLGLFAIAHFGYLLVAPLLALAIMLLLGERRWFWLFTGAVLVPAAIWLFIEILLSRPLP